MEENAERADRERTAAQPSPQDVPGLDAAQLEGLLRLSQCFQQGETDVIVYDRALTVLKDLTGFSSCSIHLLNRTGLEMYLVASRDVPDSIPDSIIEATLQESMDSGYMKPLLAKDPYRPIDHIEEGDQLSSVSAASLFQGEMVKVPLLSDGALVGAMTLIKAEAGPEWFLQQRPWLSVIGTHLGSLMEQRIGIARLQSSALLQERAWTSRELGEHLLRSVDAIRLAAEDASAKWESGDVGGIGACLADIERLAGGAYADMNEEMVGLRFMDASEQDVLGRIRAYLARFQRQWDMKVVFTVVDPEGALNYMKGAVAQLFRVMQEALTNVRLHAQATEAEVSLETSGSLLRMLVVDNGAGFDAGAIPPDKLGLKIMGERAAEVGGTLHVISSPGEGTVVRMEIPRAIGRREGKLLPSLGAGVAQ